MRNLERDLPAITIARVLVTENGNPALREDIEAHLKEIEEIPMREIPANQEEEGNNN
jgi:hypothetical protein